MKSDHAAIAKGLEEIRKECEKYPLERILNLDETGLLYAGFPNKTYLSNPENYKTVRGTKEIKAKERISAYMCMNTTGTF